LARIKDLLVARFLNQGTYNQLAGLCIEYSCAGPSHFAEEAQLRFSAPDSFLMLSMAVFGWGLQYKLSLYKAKNSITHSVPEAKVALAGAAHGFAAGKRVPYRTAFLTKDLLGYGRSIGAWLVPGRSPLSPDWKHREARAPFPPCLESLFFRPSPVLS
jgi:hypothetical protein